jgi:hypothetical protein
VLLDGISSSAQITAALQMKLIAALADALDILLDLVKLDAIKDARRRLLATSALFRILTADANEAMKLQQKALTADVQVLSIWSLFSIHFPCSFP